MNAYILKCAVITIAVLMPCSSIHGQWSTPGNPKHCPAVPARLVVMTHGDSSSFGDMAFSPDGKTIAIASEPRGIPVAPKGVAINRSVAPASQTQGWRKVAPPAIRHGNIVRSVPMSTAIGIYDIASGECVARMCDPDVYDTYDRLFWSDDGTTLVSQTEKGQGTLNAIIWDVTKRARQAEIPPCRDAAVSPDGKHLIARMEIDGDDLLYLYDATNGDVISEIAIKEGSLDHEQRGLAYSPDGKYFAVGLTVWDAKTGTMLIGPPSEDGDNDRPLWFTPDSSQLASGHGSRPKDFKILDLENKRLVPLSDTEEFKQSQLFKGEVNFKYEALARDLALVAGTPRGNSEVHALLYSPRTGEMLAQLTVPDGVEPSEITGFAMSANGRTVVVARRDGATLIWDISEIRAQADRKVE